MNCEEASALVNDFIENKIDDDQVLSEYLDHICSCKNCYEELDVMFIVSQGLYGLTTNENVSFDFTGALSKKIEDAKRELKKAEIKKRRLIMIDIGCVLIIIAVIIAFALDFMM
ncbi:MAG: hypothetical protein K6F92_02460 [Lachnospiraceae bacterium]|nr:hypothetical protein [Lachnospiraceae bacterium]